jgi:hypothetical protein
MTYGHLDGSVLLARAASRCGSAPRCVAAYRRQTAIAGTPVIRQATTHQLSQIAGQPVGGVTHGGSGGASGTIRTMHLSDHRCQAGRMRLCHLDVRKGLNGPVRCATAPVNSGTVMATALSEARCNEYRPSGPRAHPRHRCASGARAMAPGLQPHSGRPRDSLVASSISTAFWTASLRGAASRKPFQLDELQPQRLDPRDEAVQRGAVDHPANQQGVGRCRTRFKPVKSCQQPWRQLAGDPEGVVSVHVDPPCRGVTRSGGRTPVDILGAVR